jgi:6-pyruvoyltetrahydropterin/6-carboxytetrahydropterin synthase
MHSAMTLLQPLLLLLVWSLPGTHAINNLPFVLGVRDSFMIAHSFHNNPKFGPAGKLHGATYTCDVEFSCAALVPDTNWVLDIGKALELLSQVLAKYNFQNLDELFAAKTLTTTEFMARQIHKDLCALLKTECQEFRGNLCVKLWESHKAWASYTAKV